jgi:hypothetical protein
VPAGARIEVNDDYVGDAPITIKVHQINGYFARNTTIRALPIDSGAYVQLRCFLGYDPLVAQSAKIVGVRLAGGGGAEIPSRILFDMRLAPIAPSN